MSEITLGVIPARAGSKRIKKKNIREVDGQPLIAYTIKQAARATNLDQVVVSTESDEIKKIAEEYGGTVPFQRPSELAADDVTNDEVVQHALNWFKSNKRTYDYVCLLSVTTPFRTTNDIDQALDELYESTAGSIASVTPYDTPPFFAVKKDKGRLEPYFDENPWNKTRTQEFETLYHPNGSIFAADVSTFEAAGGFYTEKMTAYEMPRKRSLDIDESFDLELARALMQWRNQ